MVSHAMRRARPSGGTTVVLSNSSTRSGPCVHCAPRSARPQMGVGSAPNCGPKYTERAVAARDVPPDNESRYGTCEGEPPRAITRTLIVSTASSSER